MRSHKVLLFGLPVLALASLFCSTGDFIPQGISETMQSFTQQVPALQTQVAEQLTQAAVQMTGLPGADALQTQVAEQLTSLPNAEALQTQVAEQLTQIAAGPTQQSGTDNIPTNTPPGGLSGSLAGNLSYPSEGIPPLAVVAYKVGGQPNEYYYVVTQQDQSTYQLDNLPPGSYYVVAYPMVDGNTLAGGYSQAVPCGLSAGCNDHSLIPVAVAGGQITSGIDPADWYAPEGTFPPYPLP